VERQSRGSLIHLQTTTTATIITATTNEQHDDDGEIDVLIASFGDDLVVVV